MNKYREILFQHLDGIVLIPTLTGLYKSGILDLMIDKQKFSIIELSKHKKLNPGYLNVSLRLLRSLGFLKFINQNNEMENIYITNNKFMQIAIEIDKLKDLDGIIKYHIDFNRLNKTQIPKYINLLNSLSLLIKNNTIKSTNQFYINIEGLMIGPILANLSFYKHLEIESGNLKLVNLDSLIKQTFLNIFKTTKLISNEKRFITDKGNFFFKKSSSYGVTVSYLKTLSNIKTLLVNDQNYIWNRTKDNHEIHVNRSMNVWGSGGAHKIYFKKIDNIIINIFNQKIEDQPLGVIDIGCGDGSFLKHIYLLIISKTNRRKYIESHPLILIGTDINQKAQDSTKKTLEGIRNIIINGDISNPDDINDYLNENHNLKLGDFLNCRTFLDHNRIYEKPLIKINHNIKSTGSFCHKGLLIPIKDLITNFIIHLSRWKPFIKKHGLIIVELHTINPSDTLKNIGKSLACAYDATHGYSDQYLIEYEVYKKCILEIGMNITSENEYLFPKEIPTVSINYIK